jgi:mRNA interferase RelE/StbE
MSAFSVILMPEAQGDIGRLDPIVQARILNRLQWMSENADEIRHEQLRGDRWRGCLRFRVGDYRIIYQIDRSALELNVLKVGHRRDIYR